MNRDDRELVASMAATVAASMTPQWHNIGPEGVVIRSVETAFRILQAVDQAFANLAAQRLAEMKTERGGNGD